MEELKQTEFTSKRIRELFSDLERELPKDAHELRAAYSCECIDGGCDCYACNSGCYLGC